MYLGIDFGTSFSQAASMYLNNPLLMHPPGDYGIPSVFYYDRMNDRLVGQDALDAGQGRDAANLVTDVKMKLNHPYMVLDGEVIATKEIVREIMKSIVLKAAHVAKTRKMDPRLRGVVLCVPAKFGMQERKLIRDAAQWCLKDEPAMCRELNVDPEEGIRVTDIIKEPVAAALAYYRTEAEDNQRILVFDLGGGTCDVALVRADASLMEHYDVEDSDMIRLGGRNWDENLANYIADMIRIDHKIDIRNDPGHAEKVRRAAVSVKHKLSDSARTRAIAQVEINGSVYSVCVRRNVFDEVTSGLLNKALDCLQDVYDRSPRKSSIRDIICVGGSSNMLQVEEGIRRRFPQCNVKVFTPEHAVVSGAAAYADMLGDNIGSGIQVSDIASFSYGVEIFLDYNRKLLGVSNILLKGSKLPASYTRHYNPVAKTSMLSFKIYESEYTDKDYAITCPNKRCIGRVELRVPGMDPNTSVKCQIRLNCQGILEATVTHPNGKKETVPIDLNELGAG